MGAAAIIGASAAKTGLDILSTRIAQNRQQKHNMELAKYQNAANQQYLREQLEYDTPKNQMKRFLDAGLNPNLIYDKGTGGNQGSPLSFPEIKPTDMTYGQLGTNFMDGILKGKQAELMETQKDLNKVKVDTETVNQELKRVQTAVLNANPFLNPDYLNSVVSNMKAIAQMKIDESAARASRTAYHDGQKVTFPDGYAPNTYEIEIVQKINKLALDYKLDSQAYETREQDQKIKAEILKSKEFQNTLQQIEVEWMKNADITPQHIFKGIMLLIQKMM